MKIEVERAVPLSIVYIYLRNHEERSTDTISHVKGEMLFDYDDNWIGLRILNERVNEEEFEMPEFNLGKDKNIILAEDGDEITIFFDSDSEVYKVEEELFYINFDEDGLYGIEVILKSDDIKLDKMTHLISNI